MKLRTKKSHLQTLPEGAAPHRILPVVLKFFYYLVLVGIVAGLGYVVAMRYLYFTGKGQVEIEKIKISSLYGGKIETLHRQAGDSVSSGAALAVINTGIECPLPAADIRPIRLDYDIKAKESELDIYARQMRELGKEYTVGILPRALEINNDLSVMGRQREIDREMKRLQEKMDLLSGEITVKRRELVTLKEALPVPVPSGCGLEVITAAFAADVYHVLHHAGEFIKKGEPLFIMTPQDAKVRIEAFFERKHMRYIAHGQTLIIEFPDRTISRGKIIGYSSAASYFADREQKDYLPVESLVRVNLEPVDPSDAARWRRYDRMDVLVKGER